MKKRIISFALVLAMICVMLPELMLEAKATEDWRTWMQSDSRWGSINLGNSGCTMSSDGCLVTSVAKIMVQSGFVNYNSFNPGELVKWLNRNNNEYPDQSFTAGGGLFWAKPTKMISGFSLVNHQYGYENGITGNSSSCEDRIMELVRSNYHIILAVNGYGHYVAVDNATSLKTGRVYIMDSLRDTQNANVLLVDRYSTVADIALYSGWTDEALANIVCNHNQFNNLGICEVCNAEYNWQSSYNTSCAGMYKVSLNGGVYLRTDKPYSASTAKSQLIPKGTKVQVLGSVKNHYSSDNEWYKVSYNGVVGYTNANNLTLTTHTCDKGEYVYFEAEHPHRNCYECSICHKISVDSASSNYYSSCSRCNSSKIPGKPVLNATHQNPVVFTWAATENTTHYNLWIETKNNTGNWEVYEWISYATSGVSRNLPVGEYRLQLQSYNSNVWAEDGSDWLYTASAFSYVTIGCNHSYSSKVTTAATCGKSGIKTYTCNACGDSYTEAIPATGNHTYDNGKVVTPAYCGSTGTKVYTCGNCGTQKTETLFTNSPTGKHGFFAEQIPATGSEPAKTRYSCAWCGYSYEVVANANSGVCGDNVRWSQEGETLTIYGDGPMYDYENAGPGDSTSPFNSMTGVKKVVIQPGVTTIGTWSFYMKTDIVEVELPETVTSIKRNAFANCYGLRTVKLPASIQNIEVSAFDYCNNLHSVYYRGTGSQWADISIGADNEYLTDATIYYNVGSDTESVVANGSCGPGLTWTLDQEGKLLITGAGVMNNYQMYPGGADTPWSIYVDRINKVVIDNGVTTIGEYAFALCKDLKEIQLGESVQSIDDGAFYRCEKLQNITLPASILSIHPRAFDGCKNLSGIWVDPNNSTFCSDGSGVVYSKTRNALIKAPNNLTGSYRISSGVESIWSSAFYDCRNLTEIIMPYGVMFVEKDAFGMCVGLSTVVLPESLRVVADGAFSGCANLTTVTIPSNLESIGNAAFLCQNLANVYYAGSQIQWNQIAIDENNEDLTNATIFFAVHTHDFTNYVFNNDATCTNNGTKTARCNVVGCNVTKSLIVVNSVLGHSFTNYISNNDATYDADGTKTAKCDRCDATDTVADEGTKLVAKNGWKFENKKWYYYKDNVKKTGWVKDGSFWYYMNKEGVMQIGWLKQGNTWYYLKPSGNMATGWCQVGGVYYYFDANGYMKTGWLQQGSTWYYLKPSGAMAVGWCQVGSTWYYFNTSGAMKTGWLQLGNTWYYLKSSGAMATGSLKIGTKTYNFNSSGACLNP